jgi:hypothetical protein
MLMLSYAPVGATPPAEIDPENLNPQQTVKDENIVKLQKALKLLATNAGVTAFDPGPATGFVNPTTVSALTAVLPALTGYISSEFSGVVKTSLEITYIFKPEATAKFVKDNAGKLAGGVTGYVAALAAKRAASGAAPGSTGTSTGITQTTFILPTRAGGGTTFTPPPPPAVIAQPWYKQAWGMAAIGVGAVGFLSLLVILTRR